MRIGKTERVAGSDVGAKGAPVLAMELQSEATSALWGYTCKRAQTLSYTDV